MLTAYDEFSGIGGTASRAGGGRMSWVVEVNEGAVEATRRGADWWAWFAQRFHGTGRLTYTTPPSVIGGVVEVACDDRGHADWLAGQMVDAHGLPATAVRVKRGARVGAA